MRHLDCVEDIRSANVMEGKGFYDRHSHLQFQAVLKGIPLLERGAQSVPISNAEHNFIISDYGSSQGHNSLLPMSIATNIIQDRCSDNISVSIYHTDLPSNDFNSLFLQLDESSESYLKDRKNVYAFATGKTFYEEIFPEAYVNLGWSSITVHWLSRVPCLIPDHIWITRASEETRAKYAQVAREDWYNFLKYRGKELKPGGRLVLVARLADDKGNTGAEDLHDMANDVLQDMVSEGILLSGEYERMVIGTYYRRLEDYKEPFSDRIIGDILDLELCNTDILIDPIYEEYTITEDREKFAFLYSKFFEAYSEASFLKALDPYRTPDDKEHLLVDFYERVRTKIKQDPKKAACAWRIALLLIKKKENV